MGWKHWRYSERQGVALWAGGMAVCVKCFEAHKSTAKEPHLLASGKNGIRLICKEWLANKGDCLLVCEVQGLVEWCVMESKKVV